MDNSKEVDQDDDQILSPGNIWYTSRPIPLRRRLRNVITVTPRAILHPRSEKASFKTVISEGILHTILMHTNRKLQEIQRRLHVRYPTASFFD